MTTPTPGAPTLRDVGVSIIRTFVAIAVGTALAWLAQHLGIVFDGPTQDGVVQTFTAFVIGVYYAVARFLESKSKVFGFLLGLTKQPTYLDQNRTRRF